MISVNMVCLLQLRSSKKGRHWAVVGGFGVSYVAFQRWAKNPQPTCKGKTRKDFCFISPELQALLIDVVVQHDVWSDHSVLAGVFQGSPKDILQHWWKQLASLSWPNSFKTSQVHINVQWDTVDPTEGYKQMWNQIETSASEKLQTEGEQVPTGLQVGRGATLETIVLQGQRRGQQLKKGRMGDVMPTYHGQSVQHAQWFRQLRRLQSYVRYRQCQEVETEAVHSVQLWRSILCAKSFPSGFQLWWRMIVKPIWYERQYLPHH